MTNVDLKELHKAHKVAREDLRLATKALKAGIAERLDDAVGILCECRSALHDICLGDADFDMAVDTIQNVAANLAGDEGEVADD